MIEVLGLRPGERAKFSILGQIEEPLLFSLSMAANSELKTHKHPAGPGYLVRYAFAFSA